MQEFMTLLKVKHPFSQIPFQNYNFSLPQKTAIISSLTQKGQHLWLVSQSTYSLQLTPTRNKGLIRPYQRKPPVNTPLIRPCFWGGVSSHKAFFLISGLFFHHNLDIQSHSRRSLRRLCSRTICWLRRATNWEGWMSVKWWRCSKVLRDFLGRKMAPKTRVSGVSRASSVFNSLVMSPFWMEEWIKR